MKNGVNFTGVQVKGWTWGFNPPHVTPCYTMLHHVKFYDAVHYIVFLVMLVWPYMSPWLNNNGALWTNVLRYIGIR